MAYPDPKNVKNIQQRWHSFSDSGKAPFTELQLKLLERDFNYFLKDAGIALGKDREIPKTAGVPRIFVLAVDEEGNEKPMTPQEAGIDMSPNSPGFWRQVAMGNVFAYPAGSEHPVQLRAGDNKDAIGGDFGYTEPVAPEKMPARQIKKPGVFARFFNMISGGRWYKDVAAYDKQVQQGRTGLSEKISQMHEKRAGGNIDNELAEAQNAARIEAENKAQKDLERELANARNAEKEFQTGYETLHSVYKPIPEKKKSLIKTKDKEGLYTEEHFRDLKPIGKDELDLSRIIIAPKGKLGPAASEMDFCAVAMFAGMKYENAEGSEDLSEISDIHAVESFKKNLGLTEAQARQLHSEGYSNIFTSDLFHIRDNSGGYFKIGVNNARQDTANAFNAYKNGDKKPLAKLIAFGIDRTAAETVNVIGTPGSTAKGKFRMGAHLLSLMEKDPELKNLAMQSGMTEKQLKTVKATTEYLKLDDARKRANVKLLEAAAEHRDLPADEKKACMEAIVKPTLVEKMWIEENRTDNEKQREIEGKMLNIEPIPEGKEKAWKKDPSSRPAPPEGKFWEDTGSRFVENAKQMFKPVPKAVSSLSDQTELDRITKQIVSEDHVENMSCEELYKLYGSKGRSAGKLPERAVKIAEKLHAVKDAPEAGPNIMNEGPNRDININKAGNALQP